jgi:REP element-mobilizing transposase RayT
MMKTTEYTRKNQPHFQHIGATFSITLMAHDAVPKIVLASLQEERKAALAQIAPNATAEEHLLRAKIHGDYENKLEELLHAHSEQEHLFRDAEIAGVVMDQIHKYDNQYYTLETACIMSNHVHLLLDFSVQVPENWEGEVIPGYKNVGDIVGYIKGGASYRVNKAKERNGSLWSMGYYDRYIRSTKHYDQAFAYIINNPVKAGLVKDWRAYPYTYVKENVA